jgi:predicted ATP-grasp superfamily ATP-dependent carboligase
MANAPRAGSRVLVTDGEFKHTLGIVRALADAGHDVHLLARSARAPAVHSRSVRRWYEAPASGADLAARMADVAARLAPVSVVAVGSASMAVADRMRGLWPADVGIAMPPERGFSVAGHKDETAKLARSLGIDTPREMLVHTPDEARRAVQEIGLPLVLKSSREEGRKALRYVREARTVESSFAAVQASSTEGVLAQEYVAGAGYGMSALYQNGRRLRTFMHRRIREWPPTGGASAAAESVPECPPLEQAGARLLDALAWNGVAMVEFKGDPDGRLVLIEINAKFWGSHDLALASGVLFPCDLVALIEGRALEPQRPVRSVRFTWPLGGDLWHGVARPSSLPRVLWDAISPGVAHNVRVSDPMPHVYELMQWARSAPGAWQEFRDLR